MTNDNYCNINRLCGTKYDVVNRRNGSSDWLAVTRGNNERCDCAATLNTLLPTLACCLKFSPPPYRAVLRAETAGRILLIV